MVGYYGRMCAFLGDEGKVSNRDLIDGSAAGGGGDGIRSNQQTIRRLR